MTMNRVPGYFVARFDTLPAAQRNQLFAQCRGWEVTGKAQFYIYDEAGEPADWPLLDSYAEATKDCREFNLSDDEDTQSEKRGLAMMDGTALHDWEG